MAHLIVRAIPAAIPPSSTLSSIISTPTPTQQQNAHATLAADIIPDAVSTQPRTNDASPTSTAVILDSSYLGEVSDLAVAGRELRRDATASGSSATSSASPSGTTGSAAPTFSAACVDPAVCCITADQCKQNSGPYTATSTRNEAGTVNGQSLAWPVMAVAGVLMALGL